MKFITVRDLRSKSAQIQKELPEQKEMVLTSNGKPIAILSAVSGQDLDVALAAIRRARALTAVTAMQVRSHKAGKDKIGLEDINKEINLVRRKRHKK